MSENTELNTILGPAFQTMKENSPLVYVIKPSRERLLELAKAILEDPDRFCQQTTDFMGNVRVQATIGIRRSKKNPNNLFATLWDMERQRQTSSDEMPD